MNKIESAIERTKNKIKLLNNQKMYIEAKIEAMMEAEQILEMVNFNTSIPHQEEINPKINK